MMNYSNNPMMEMWNKSMEMAKNFDVNSSFDPKKWSEMSAKMLEAAPWMSIWNNQSNRDENQANMFNMAENMKNMEMFSDVHQLTLENAQALMRRQAEIIQRHSTDLFKLMQDLATAPNPEATMVRQADYFKAAFESLMHDYRELTEMYSKAHIETCTTAGEKISEQMNKTTKPNSSTKAHNSNKKQPQ